MSQENYDKLIEVIEKEFDTVRVTRLKNLYNDFKDRIIVAPASGCLHYHAAYEGGYLDHIHGVMKAAVGVTKMLQVMGAVIDYERSELMFAAMHHDLGKLGDLYNPYYLPNDSEWHIKNQGKVYKHNPALNYMSVPDRAMFILQHYGVTMTEKEMVGIRLADGLYDEGNKKYLISYNTDHKIGTLLPNAIHFADHIATLSERSLAGYV
jgi:hypothetical protein